MNLPALLKLSLSSSWGAEHDTSFEDLKQQLAAWIKLANSKSRYDLSLFTDASDTHWAEIVTERTSDNRKIETEKRRHEPLCFLCGAFTGLAASCSVPQKVTVESICRLASLVMGREVAIFTDHANLVYLHDPYCRNSGILRHTACKLMRWVIKLSAFCYAIEHLPVERNVWADTLNRWALNSKRKVAGIKVICNKS